MTVLGLIIGLLLGAAFESFKGAMFLAIIGAIAGHLLGRHSSQAGNGSTTLGALETQIKNMQDQMQRMSQRIAELEARLGLSPSTKQQEPAKPAESASVTPTTVHDDELTRQELGTKTDSPIAPAAESQKEPTIKTPVTSAPLKMASSHDVHATPLPQTASAQANQTPTATSRTSTQKPASSLPPKKPAEPTAFTRFVQRWVIGGNPLVKIGVLILFLGLAFLLRYVAEHSVVPIELRYAGVAATGIGLLLFGWRWRHKKDNYGVILQGAGIGVLYLTTLTGMKLHSLIPLEFGFAILFGVAIFAALLAILQDALALAIAASLGGFAAPVLASTGSAHHTAFFTYLTLINLGIVAIAWFKTWRVLNLIGFVCSFALAAAWGEKYYEPKLFSTAEPFLLLLFVLYVLITFLFARRTLTQAPEENSSGFEDHVRHAAPHVSYVDGTLVFGVPIVTFGLQYLIAKHFEYGAAFSALGFGLAYIVLAFALFRKTGGRYALLNETMIALAFIFGSLAIPLGLEQKWTSAAWAVEAAGVYWIGIRQLRVHARLFALLLLFGSAVYFALGVHIGNDEAVLDGSLLGSAMLALAIWCVYTLLRRAPAQQLHGFEHATRGWLIAFGALFIALMPFMLWPMNWAGTALAILGTVAVFSSQRLSERSLMYWGCAYQALAGALFMTTLRGAAGGSVLSNGWIGLLTASLIGASMLTGVWAMARHTMKNNDGKTDAPVQLSGIATLSMLAGLAFINLAPLFVLPWRLAAMVWPLTGLATLWCAVRARHTGALVFALALQVLAGVAYFGSHFGSYLFYVSASPEMNAAKPFMHSGFCGPLLISVAAFICAYLLQRKQSRTIDISLGWVTLYWAVAWWAFAWTDEIRRVTPIDMTFAVLIEIAIISVWLWSVIARWRTWLQLGQATLVYVPALILLLAAESESALAHPLASWCAIAWPLALAAHILLLLRQRDWLARSVLDLAHIVGAWLFVIVAAMELRWQFAHWTSSDTAWPLLGWMIAPIVYLLGMTSTALRQRWPLRDHFHAYVVISASPMVAYLLSWVWIANIISDGTATPLPYVPLLNPLEIAQSAVLLGVTLWWWKLRQHEAFRPITTHFSALIGATALSIVTGMVMRTCHHWGGIAWQSDALLASTLVQTSLSIVWSIVAIGLMLFGNRNRKRWVWIVGATLIGVVVAKLFLVELAAKGSLARIVSFIVVGLLLLLVGYFAPLPPKRSTNESDLPSSTSDKSIPV
ncbi:MAG TPA: DUF2339 domain-containing protein [Burkholderiaceae bacterium]|jgi:uncharacterized membrane protein